MEKEAKSSNNFPSLPNGVFPVFPSKCYFDIRNLSVVRKQVPLFSWGQDQNLNLVSRVLHKRNHLIQNSDSRNYEIEQIVVKNKLGFLSTEWNESDTRLHSISGSRQTVWCASFVRKSMKKFKNKLKKCQVICGHVTEKMSAGHRHAFSSCYGRGFLNHGSPGWGIDWAAFARCKMPRWYGPLLGNLVWLKVSFVGDTNAKPSQFNQQAHYLYLNRLSLTQKKNFKFLLK